MAVAGKPNKNKAIDLVLSVRGGAGTWLELFWGKRKPLGEPCGLMLKLRGYLRQTTRCGGASGPPSYEVYLGNEISIVQPEVGE